jgi:membrane protease YdiL (CAAX protease family)
MSIRKALLQFLKLFLIIVVIGEGINELSIFFTYKELTTPLFTVLAILFSYWLLFKFVLKKKIEIEIKESFKPIQDNLIFPIILIAVGFEFFEKPLFDIYNNLFIPNVLLNKISSHPQNAELNFPFIIYTFITLLIAPVFEEVLFRKYLLGNLLKQNSVQKSVLISSLFFALFHLPDFQNLLPTFLFGIVAGCIYFKTKNISYTIFFHFIYNFFITLQKLFGATLFENLNKLHFNIFYWMITVFGGMTILYLGAKLFRKNVEKREIEV